MSTTTPDATAIQELPPVMHHVALGSNGAASNLAGKPRLATALVGAIRACSAVAHDAVNQHHKYRYTSAEAILREARVAMAANGLALIPLDQTVNGHEREGPDRYELVQQRLLVHESGESVVCRSAWPIMPDRGRPLDKATAAADTLSLAYFLRDLLQMPRVDPADDVAGRDDTGRLPKADQKRLADAIRATAVTLNVEAGPLSREMLAAFSADRLSRLTVTDLQPAMQWLADRRGQTQPTSTSPQPPSNGQIQQSGILLEQLQKRLQEARIKADVKAVGRDIASVQAQIPPADLNALRQIYKESLASLPESAPAQSENGTPPPTCDDSKAVRTRRMLLNLEQDAVGQGLCQPGRLIQEILEEARGERLPADSIDDIVRWPESVVDSMDRVAKGIIADWKEQMAAGIAQEQDIEIPV